MWTITIRQSSGKLRVVETQIVELMEYANETREVVAVSFQPLPSV